MSDEAELQMDLTASKTQSFKRYAWFVASQHQSNKPPMAITQVTYSVVPAGMVEAYPARPLLPGHYWVDIRASGHEAKTDFDIEASGVIAQKKDIGNRWLFLPSFRLIIWQRLEER